MSEKTCSYAHDLAMKKMNKAMHEMREALRYGLIAISKCGDAEPSRGMLYVSAATISLYAGEKEEFFRIYNEYMDICHNGGSNLNAMHEMTKLWEAQTALL